MCKFHLSILLLALAVGFSHQSYVSVSAAKSKVGKFYAQGCSGLTAELLGRQWKKAESYSQGAYLGANGSYSGVTPGAIVGFPGHVAVYTGERGCIFVDVQGPNKNARCLSSYGSQRVYKYNY